MQYQNWSVCQICGRIVKRGTDDDWLDEPWMYDPDFRVVRCPKHWSQWALRNTTIGRRRDLQEKIHRLRREYADWPDIPPFIPPYPIEDI